MLQDSPVQAWPPATRLFFRFSFVFTLLYLLSDPLLYSITPLKESFTNSFFTALAKWTGKTFFHFSETRSFEIASDSAGYYLHFLNLLSLSWIAAFAWTFIDRKRTDYEKAMYWLFAGIRYYLAFIMLYYGFDKVIKHQFYLPEPNILFTPAGRLYRQELYWSVMGTSHSYVMFLGITEMLAGALLLFRRTYIAGAILTFLVMTNVLMTNIGFNISVKLFSVYLLLFAFILLAPELKKLFQFFFSGKPAALEKWKPAHASAWKQRAHYFAKTAVIAFILFNLGALYSKANSFNDDLAPRPPLHGAYDVTVFVKNSDTLLPLLTDEHRWRRVFVNRFGYFIVQRMNDEMTSYGLHTDTKRRKLMIAEESQRPEYYYLDYTVKEDNALWLDGIFKKDTLHLELKKIDPEKLPLLQKDFEWISDN